MDKILGSAQYLSVLPIDVPEKENAACIDDYMLKSKNLEFD